MRILFLDLDTLRADHLGCYGYHRNTSPAIDSIAAEGLRFENYYCSDAPCLPSRSALFTGRFGIHTGVVGHGGSAADPFIEGATRGFRDRLVNDSLPGLLRSAGFKTATVSPFAERHSAWWFYAGFNEMLNTGNTGNESAEEITPSALKWIRDNGAADNWFLHVNYWDPHTPYRAPEDFGNPFEGEPLPEWLTGDVLEKHREMVGPHCARELAMYHNRTDGRLPRWLGEITDMADMRTVIDGYDCGIRYMDTHIARLFEALREEGVFDDLVIIISADHGENFGELGIYAEHATADQATCRIPMIIRWPEGRTGVDSGLHYNLDLAPTLAELLDKEPSERWDGESYAGALTDGTKSGRDYLVVSQCAHVCQRSVRWGDWLYMRTYHDGYHLFPDEMLYNLAEDPHERYDHAGSQPEIRREGACRLAEWHEMMMRTAVRDVDPLWTVIHEGGPFHARGHLAEYCKYLEKTGREWAVPELKKRHPGEFAR